MTDLTIENMTVSTRIAESIDLDQVATNLPDVEYQPKNIPGVVFHLSNPRSTAVLFSDGRLVFTGPKSQEEINEILNTIQSKLLIVGVPRCTNPELSTQNIVVSTVTSKRLPLATISKKLANTKYNPKQFPGLIYQTDDPNTIILLFDSGKIVCNGTNQTDITNRIEELITKLSGMGLVQ